MALEIFVMKLQVKDTEAYQEMMGINYETFWEISAAILVILPLPFGLSPLLGKTADLTTIIHHLPLVQTAKTIINYHVEFRHVQTT